MRLRMILHLRDVSGYFSQAMHVLTNRAACHNAKICVFYEISLRFHICSENRKIASKLRPKCAKTQPQHSLDSKNLAVRADPRDSPAPGTKPCVACHTTTSKFRAGIWCFLGFSCALLRADHWRLFLWFAHAKIIAALIWPVTRCQSGPLWLQGTTCRSAIQKC